jgi:hypothetical protein
LVAVVHEQVHQRASSEQQEGQERDHVCPMFREQEIGDHKQEAYQNPPGPEDCPVRRVRPIFRVHLIIHASLLVHRQSA